MTHGQVPTIQNVQKTVGVAQAQYIAKIVDVPVVSQRQMPNPITQVVDRPVPVPQVMTQLRHVLVPHVMTEEVERLGTKRLEGGEGQGEGEQSGSASETRNGAHSRTGSTVRKESCGGVQSPAGTSRRACQAHCGAENGSRWLTLQDEMMQPSPSASLLLPTGKGFFNLAGGFRGGRPRPATRAQEAGTLTDETLVFFVNATGKDEASMRQQFTNMKLEGRDRWRTRAEEEERFQSKKEEACNLFERQPSPVIQKTREKEFTRSIRTEKSKR